MDSEKKQLELDKRYIRMANIWAENSYCQRRKVGALIVKDKMIISDGYNGTPSGFENVCEDENNLTFYMRKQMPLPKLHVQTTVATVLPCMSPPLLASNVRS